MKLTRDDKKFLELYSDSNYAKPSVTVDAVILRLFDIESDNYRKLPEKKLQVFLKKREYAPYKNTYSIIGTFIDLNYELSDSLKLCVKKKISLVDYYYEQLFTFGEKSRDPRTRVLSASYMLLTNKFSHLQNGEWFDIETNIESQTREETENGFLKSKIISINLVNDNLILKNKIKITITKEKLLQTKTVEILHSDIAFDHIKIIFYAIERLKNKLEYTDIIFNLLPEKFTLTELKKSYETILEQSLLDANFRRKISKMVEPIDEYDTGKGFRSSQMFVHKTNWNLNDLD